ncbi:unnamed protein product, partial [Menidia menidia]
MGGLMLPSIMLALCFLLEAGAAQRSGFRVCAFNLHHFGESKSRKSDVMQTLARIISRCDVCLLQEVRDSKGTALPKLLEQIRLSDPAHAYKSVASARLGRTESYQEQYVFVYRSDTATLADTYQYPDDLPGDEDAFAREPSDPAHAYKSVASARLGRTESYQEQYVFVYRSDTATLADTLFWLLPEDSDSTVRASTSCSYDRIVVHGETFNRAVVPFSARAFNFQAEYRLTEEQ